MSSTPITKVGSDLGSARLFVVSGLSLMLAAGCGGSDDTGCIKLTDESCVHETFANPPLLQPNAAGVYELELKPTEFMVDGKRHCGRGYNGLYPAPTIETKAESGGEKRQIRVNLHNRFTKSDYHTLENTACTCTDTVTMMSCTPPSGHGGNTTCACKDDKGMMCHLFDFNTTNLHAHGSHVRPDYATGGGCVEDGHMMCRSCSGDPDTGSHDCFFADDVISRVSPGMGAQHRWDIDEDGEHHAGLNWYHPHIHGSTAIQVGSGATGAWIVRGPLDEIPGIKNAKERIMVITTPPTVSKPLADGEPCDEDHLTFNDFTPLSTTQANETNLINGMRRPRIVMPPGQIERWRLLHGSFLDEAFYILFRGADPDCNHMDLKRPPVKLTQIGRDGIPLPKPASGEDWPFAPPYIFLSPGYRVEAMLDGTELADGDTLCLMSARFLQNDTTGTTPDPVGIMTPPTPEDIIKAASNGDVVAIVNVTKAAGEPTETKMPDLSVVAQQSKGMMLQGGSYDALAKCDEAKAVTKVADIDQLAELWMLFMNTSGFDGCSCDDHNINCKNFEVTDRSKYPYDRVMKVGAVDHWRVISGFDGHPFHIHINPFLVCPLPPAGSPDPNTKGRIFEPPFAHWRDTYLVNLDRRLDMLTEYRTYAGSYVFHCHKLTHEDHGMMELVHVCDPKTESCDTLCSGGPCGWQSCAAGDESCQRALVATECILDPSKCPEAALRCAECDGGKSCPPAAYCRSDKDPDGHLRCAPGCVTDTDCALTEVCTQGACAAAPACAPPCMPGTSCQHGACK